MFLGGGGTKERRAVLMSVVQSVHDQHEKDGDSTLI